MAESRGDRGRTTVGEGDVYAASVWDFTVAGQYLLHYVLGLWVDAWRKKCAQGDVIVVRYADDSVLGFQHQAEADRFLDGLRERLMKFVSD
jgi:hypothetical protein